MPNQVQLLYGLNRVLYGNDEFTHFVYIGASDFVTLTDGATELTSSKLKKFSRKVKGMREVLNTSLVIPVKAGREDKLYLKKREVHASFFYLFCS